MKGSQSLKPESGDPIETGEGDYATGQLAVSEVAHLARLALIGEMVACFAHEVSNPLTLVHGHLRLIAEQTHDSSTEESVRTAMEAAERIQQMASRMLDFSRKKPASTGPVRLKDVVDDACIFILPYLKMRSVSFELEAPAEAGPIVTDRDLLVQVLVNLFQNAADAMVDSARRTLRVVVAPGKMRVRIEECDSGRGIPAAHLQRIFEPFFTSKGAGGTGLGLYIARQLVMRDLKGTLEARSDSDGSTFTITLPHTPLVS